jgi:hypothetical protein
MSLWQRALVARQVVGKQLKVLYLIDGRAAVSSDFRRASQRLQRWQEVTARLLTDTISPAVGQEFRAKYDDLTGVIDLRTLSHIRLVYQTYMYQLLEELKYSPENVLSP